MKKTQSLRPFRSVLLSLMLPVFFIFPPSCMAVFPAHEESHLYESQLRFDRAPSEEPVNKELQPGREIADPKGRYIVEWIVDYKTKTITFEIECKTVGWVGLGLSVNGTMKDADIVIAGVYSTGQTYIADMHTDYNRKLYSDSKQDWVLNSAVEMSGVTQIVISRHLDTCDPYDYPITMDLLSVIWAFGETDVIEYHFDKRGSFRVYLLDPIIKPEEGQLSLWEIRSTITLSGRTTEYICSVHKAPVSTKHQIIEVQSYLENGIAVEQTHHMNLYRCVAPPGMDQDEIFGPLVDTVAEECFFNNENRIPILFCQFLITGWGIGGKPFKLPHAYGFPVGESPTEYYMLQTHYNNHLGYFGDTYTTGMNLYLTDQLRPNDAMSMFLGSYDIFGLFIVPPVSTDFKVYGYCTSDCTQTMFPESGVEVVSVLLHAHLSGRKMKLQQFRNGTEMEVLMKDDNYDSTFQQQRLLYEPRLVLPGDLIVITCEYDNTWSNTTTVSGFSTQEEMCVAGVVVSKRLSYSHCNSQIPQETLLPLIGVSHVEWDIDSQQRIITEPHTLAGTFLREVLDWRVDWSKDLRYRMQDVSIRSTEIGMCPQILTPPGVEGGRGDGETVESLRGVMFHSTADTSNILELATKYGVETLMGTHTLPTRTPGPISYANYPFIGIKYPARTCPKIQSPFTAYTSHYSHSQIGRPNSVSPTNSYTQHVPSRMQSVGY